MAMGWTAVIEILKRSTVGDAFMEVVFFFIPLWVAVLIGLFIGWAWKPKWAFLSREKFDIAKVLETASVRLSLTPSFDSSDNWYVDFFWVSLFLAFLLNWVEDFCFIFRFEPCIVHEMEGV